MANGALLNGSCVDLNTYLEDQHTKLLDYLSANDCVAYAHGYQTLAFVKPTSVPSHFFFTTICGPDSVRKNQNFSFTDPYETCALEDGGLDPVNAPLSYDQSAAFWSASFVTVVSLYLVCKNIGLILEAIKKW